MRAIGYRKAGAITEADALVALDLPRNEPEGRDIEVEVKAISINPVDVKLRGGVEPKDGLRILGWDAAGVVTACGPDAELFSVGDRVFYAGALDRPGCYSQFHLVDERIVGRMPETLDFASAAALPLTAITAWEALFERLELERDVPGAANAILVIGGAGGVGSIAIQLLKKRTGLTVIATAARRETRDWVGKLGADHVIDHSKAMAPQIEALGIGAPAYVFSTNNTEQNVDDIAALIAPQGRLCLIDDPKSFNINPFKAKSVSVHWEFMFTRSLLRTEDMAAQHELLCEVARLIDDGEIKTTLTKTLQPIDVENLLEAHRLVEGGHMIGKVVLADW